MERGGKERGRVEGQGSGIQDNTFSLIRLFILPFVMKY